MRIREVPTKALRRLKLQGVHERIDAVGHDVRQVSDRASRVEGTADRAVQDAETHVRELNRVAPQLAALEAKVEDLRQRLERAPRVDGDGDLDAARTLVDAIQREHEQIRVRLSAVTTYEERLRRIEEHLGLPHD